MLRSQFTILKGLTLIASLSLVLFFQNCGSSKQFSTEVSNELPSESEEDFSVTGDCKLENDRIQNGTTVVAYSSPTVPYGQACVQEIRKCQDTALSGSYAYASCKMAPPATCSFNGFTVAHGAPVAAYASATVPYGQTCTPSTRVCNNGVLSGTNPYGTCSVASPASCNLNGTPVAHGSPITGYATPTVPAGQTCVSQSRTCNNGSLSGTYAYSSCAAEGLVSTKVAVTISCSVNAANHQVLRAVLKDGSVPSWNIGSGNTSTSFSVTFNSPPTTFQALSNGALSAHRYSNQTARTLYFSSEDGGDSDYNDLVCSFSW